jgi:FkbM family methyltransferase
MVPRCALFTGGTPVAHIYDDLFSRLVYESPKPLPPAPVIVDAGGHLGLASMFFLWRYPGCRLTTVEANPALASLLRRNLMPWADQTRIVEAALSTRDGSIDFHVTEDNPLNVTGGIGNREAPERRVNKLTVSCIDARTLLTEPVDLMKLDIEGHEYEVLRLDVFNPSWVHNLVIEFHDIDQPVSDFLGIIHLLRERGYRFARQDGVALSVDEVRRLKGCVVLKLF